MIQYGHKSFSQEINRDFSSLYHIIKNLKITMFLDRHITKIPAKSLGNIDLYNQKYKHVLLRQSQFVGMSFDHWTFQSLRGEQINLSRRAVHLSRPQQHKISRRNKLLRDEFIRSQTSFIR